MNILFPPQQDVLDSGFIDSNSHYFINMATGTGKTYLAELAIEKVISENYKAIYITPLRALAQQQYTKWKTRFKDNRIGVFTGETSHKVSRNNHYCSSKILIMTPERFDACLRNWRTHWTWLPDVSLVIIDEFHIMNQGYRGARLEGTITRMIRLNPFVRFVALSATMPNSAFLAKWLHGKNYESKWRQITIDPHIERFSSAKDKPSMMLTYVKKCISNGGQSIVFCNSRSRVQQLTEFLISNDISATSHHAGLVQEVRTANEKGYCNGKYDVMVATSTVEMGLNFPTRQVIIYDSYAYTENGFSPLPVWSYIQRMGRAGRPGLDSSGEAILFLPKWSGDATKYLTEDCEPVVSSLSNSHALTEQLLVDIFGGFSRTREELSKGFIPLTLYHAEHPDVNLNGLINRLILNDMLHEYDDDAHSEKRLKITTLGRMAVKLMFAPETVTLIYKYKKIFPTVYLFDLLLIACMTPDCSPILHASYEEMDFLCETIQILPSTILDNRLEILQKRITGTPNTVRFLDSVKMAAICYTYASGKSFEEIASMFDVYESDLRLLQESVIRLLSGMSAISSAVDKKEFGLEFAQTETLRTDSFTSLCNLLSVMIEYGIDSSLVTLTLLDGIGGKLARNLSQNGYTSIEDLRKADVDDLVSIKGIGKKLALSIIKQAQECDEQNYTYIESSITGSTFVKSISSSIDPYRLRRSLELSVKGKDGGRFCVTGGREDHIVRINNRVFSCDCLDHTNAHNTCKHILCVKRTLQDPEVIKMTTRIKENKNHSIRETLPSLWFSTTSTERTMT